MLDVAIVGYGPAGALLARLLGKHGLSIGIFEREAGPYPLPRAVHFDGEVMRIFQSAGVADEMASVTRPTSKGMQFVNADGRVLMIRRGMEGPGPQGWHNNHYFHQPDLEGVLRGAAERCAGVTVRHNAEVVAIEDRGDHAWLKLADGARGQGEEFSARYLVGCDGARSVVRSAIGSSYDDLGLRQPWLVTDVIMRRDVGLPDYTIQHCDPARPTTACYVTGNRRRWEMMLKEGDDPVEIAKPENAWKHLSRWVTPEDAQLERTAVYTFQSVIAKGWRKGRLMIAGDAAHQTPPFIGQGMCAGMRDCANLAWKLERVLRGASGDRLLDTYEPERWPNVHAFIELAVRVGAVIQAEGAAAIERDRKFREGAPELFSYPVSRLGPGAHEGVPPAGEIFPQPRLADGRKLDDAIGGDFAVLGSRALLAQCGTRAQDAWRAMQAQIISDPGDEIDVWLREHQAGAVILRPDKYVLGVAADAAGLDALSERLATLCHANT
ncbi:MAG: bifunctional 3-(3-hydroxy-phenyl)propionate/3-hydroxycinnamic acid hydroxylase [Burkholderiales bacterium]